jgi:hypothetical protein
LSQIGSMPVSKSPPLARARPRRDKLVVTIIVFILLLFGRGSAWASNDRRQ